MPFKHYLHHRLLRAEFPAMPLLCFMYKTETGAHSPIGGCRWLMCYTIAPQMIHWGTTMGQTLRQSASNHSGGGGPHKLINIKVASDSNALLFYSEKSWAGASPNYQVSWLQNRKRKVSLSINTGIRLPFHITTGIQTPLKGLSTSPLPVRPPLHITEYWHSFPRL